MRLSTKGRYGVTAMMDLAIHDNAGPVTLADISRRLEFIAGVREGLDQIKRAESVPHEQVKRELAEGLSK